MKNATDNGKALEKAVRLIQETLLQNDATLKGSRFTVEWNKRITLDKVRHEIDVYVVTHPKTKYQSVVLFECKDWKKSVSTKEVMSLKEKVDILGATRGVLVAHKISPDAQALLERPDYNRIEFRRCTEDIRQQLQIEAVHTVHASASGIVRVAAFHSKQQFGNELRYGTYRFGDETGVFQAFASKQVDLLAKKDKKNYKGLYTTKGVHWCPLQERLEFQPGEFSVSGIAVASIEIHSIFWVTVDVSSPCYQCSVEGDGQAVFFQIKDQDFPDGALNIDMVFTAPQKNS